MVNSVVFNFILDVYNNASELTYSVIKNDVLLLATTGKV